MARGNRQSCKDYCQKEESRVRGPWEWGNWRDTTQGARSDLEAVKEAIDNGADEKEISEKFFETWCRYRNAFNAYRSLHLPQRKWRTKSYAYIGPTGVGKSRKAAAKYPNAYWKPYGTQWFDGYCGHDVIIIDEFYGWLRYGFVLRLCDRYPMLLDVKGTYTPMVARRVIFTSNKPVEDWWPNVADISAFLRRVKVVVFTSPDEIGCG